MQGGEFDNCSLSSSVITVLISNRTKVTPDNKHRMASNISHNSNEQDVGSFSYSRDPSSAADRSVFDSVAGNPAAQPAAAGAVAANPQPAAAGAVAENPQPAAAALHNLPAEVQNGHDIVTVSDLTFDSDLDFTEEETAILEAAEAIMAAARERKRLKKRKLAEEEDAKHKEKRSDNDDQDKGNGPGGVLGGGGAVAK